MIEDQLLDVQCRPERKHWEVSFQELINMLIMLTKEIEEDVSAASLSLFSLETKL